MILKNRRGIMTEKYEGVERRKYMRLGYPFFIRCRKDGEEEEGTPLVSFEQVRKGSVSVAKNITIEGICFATGKEFEVGNLVFVDVFSPTRKTPFKIVGKVVWRKKRVLFRDYNIGVQFLEIEAETKFKHLLEELVKVKLHKKLE